MEYFMDDDNRLFIRLQPGDGFLEGLLTACRETGVKGGSVTSCIGSLQRTVYTFGQKVGDAVGHRAPLISDKPTEIICAQGTIGLTANTLDVHLHALMCDVDGNIFAGHMLPGSTVYATMEIAVALACNGHVERWMDPVVRHPVFHFFKGNGGGSKRPTAPSPRQERPGRIPLPRLLASIPAWLKCTQG